MTTFHPELAKDVRTLMSANTDFYVNGGASLSQDEWDMQVGVKEGAFLLKWSRKLAASAGGAAPTCLNAWFCSLPEGRQAVLRDDKWMLAHAAFDAGRASAAPSAPSAPAAPQPNALQKLIAHTEGRLPHAGMGLCPDAVEGHGSRDPACPVCRALDAVAAPQVAAPEPITRFNPIHGLGMNPHHAGLYVYYVDHVAALDRAAASQVAAAPAGWTETHREWRFAVGHAITVLHGDLYSKIFEYETDRKTWARALNILGRMLAAAPEVATPQGWNTYDTIGRSDDLVWTYCVDTNTIDGPVPEWKAEQNSESFTHWTLCEAPSTAGLDADRAAQAACTGRAA